MSSTTKSLWLIALIAVMVSCSWNTAVTIHNNTQETVYVIFPEKNKDVAVPLNPNNALTVPLLGKGNGDIVVSNKNITLSYCMIHLPFPSWYEQRSNGRSSVILQLEPDNMLYIIAPTNSLPTRDLSNQPKGFPLKPITPIRVSLLNGTEGIMTVELGSKRQKVRPNASIVLDNVVNDVYVGCARGRAFYSLRDIPKKYLYESEIGVSAYVIIDHEMRMLLCEELKGGSFISLQPQPQGWPQRGITF